MLMLMLLLVFAFAFKFIFEESQHPDWSGHTFKVAFRNLLNVQIEKKVAKVSCKAERKEMV